ncbi:hypothetical protein Tco_0138178 [Tanacetum coccineum]
MELSKLCNPSIDLSHGHRCYLRNCLCRIYPSIPNTIPNLTNPLSSRFSIYGADKPIIYPSTSSRSSDFTSKLLNLDNPSPTDNEIASLMDITAQHATAIPKITSKTTTLLPALPYFAFVFKFNERDFNLEKDVSEIKQFDQYAQALSSIPAIVDRYMDNHNSVKKAIKIKSFLAHNLDCRQESQDEKNAYIELVDTSMGALIKEEVSQILPQAISDFTNPVIEKTVTESVEVGSCLTRRSRDNSDKDQDPSAGSDRGKKRRKFSKDVESSRDSRSKEKKSSSTQDALIQLRSYGKALPM